ncbi:MAG: serine/threonine-protein kinase, partial [Kiritimatiellia bacterium]
MNCPKCQTELPAKTKFCPECGTSVSAISVASSQERDVSLGELRTLGPAPSAPSAGERSIGAQRTMVGPGDAPAVTTGQVITGRYSLEHELGRGGFATVWLAKDLKLGRSVAVKRLLPEALQGEAGRQTLERFQREAQAIAQLNHRNIVAVYDHDNDASGPYVVMEYIAGGSLRELLKQRGKLPPAEAVELI